SLRSTAVPSSPDPPVTATFIVPPPSWTAPLALRGPDGGPRWRRHSRQGRRARDRDGRGPLQVVEERPELRPLPGRRADVACQAEQRLFDLLRAPAHLLDLLLARPAALVEAPVVLAQALAERADLEVDVGDEPLLLHGLGLGLELAPARLHPAVDEI